MLALILLAFTTQGLYHTIKEAISRQSAGQELELVAQHPIFLLQIGLFTLVIIGAYLVPKLPPHRRGKAKRREIDWSSVRKESESRNQFGRHSTKETRV